MRKTNFIKKIVSFTLALLMITVTFCGCSEKDADSQLQGSRFDSNISMVKNGHPKFIPDITYEEAYDNFFTNPQWRGFEADDGSDVVEFTGGCTYEDEDAEVYIQFVIDDDESFSMYYAEMTVGDETFEVDEQTFIELVYTPFESYSQEVLGKDLDEDVQAAFAEIYDSIE